MKKRLYIIAIAAIVAAVATSCTKENFTNKNARPEEFKGLVFHATLENGESTRTSIVNEGKIGYKISWETTDSISVNGIVYKAVPDEKNPAMATFVKMRDTDPDPSTPYKAYYPASIYDGTTATLPETQIYREDGNIAGILPMYAEGNDTELEFKNLCGLLKFTLKGTEQLQTISLRTGYNKSLSGRFTVTDYAAVIEKTDTCGVKLDCGKNGVKLDATTGKTFYIAVPAGSYDTLMIAYSTVNQTKVCEQKATATATLERNKVYSFDQTPTFTPDYLCITCIKVTGKGAQAKLKRSKTSYNPPTYQFSTDKETWTDYTFNTSVYSKNFPTLEKVGDKVYIRAKEKRTDCQDQTNYISFDIKNSIVEVSGNIMYMVDPEWDGTYTMQPYEFYGLFSSNQYIIRADRLVLPALTLSDHCYDSMFYRNNSLKFPPSLPAEKLAVGCYQSMFKNCSIGHAPSLPATSLAESCYREMFYNSGLNIPPLLPATSLAESCYREMFYDSGLNIPPLLLARSLADSCYYKMFSHCKKLTKAPTLPAKSLKNACYHSMFNSCFALGSVTMLATDISAEDCLKDWLANDAGMIASTRTIYVAEGMVDAVKETVPSDPDWKSGVKVKQ